MDATSNNDRVAMNWAMESPDARSNKQAASELERQVREASASVANNEDDSKTARQRLGDRPAARGQADGAGT